MKTTSSKSILQLMKQSQDMLAASPLQPFQAHEIWSAQSEIIGELEVYSRGWIERRRDAVGSSLKTIAKLFEVPKNPGAVIETLAEWQRGSVERAVEDVEQLLEFWSRCAGKLVDAELETGKEVLEEVEKGAQGFTESKHSIPV